MKTKCAGCGKVLTDEQGNRLEDAYFDSSLTKKKAEDDVIYAWCKECYTKKVGVMELTYSVELGNYDWANPSEKQTYIYFAVKENTKIVLSCNFTLDPENYEYWRERFDEDPIDAFREASEAWFDEILYSTEEEKVKEMLKFVDEHENELYLSFYRKRLKELERRKKRLESEIEAIKGEIERLELMSDDRRK